jgi:hypothetical protein
LPEIPEIEIIAYFISWSLVYGSLNTEARRGPTPAGVERSVPVVEKAPLRQSRETRNFKNILFDKALLVGKKAKKGGQLAITV